MPTPQSLQRVNVRVRAHQQATIFVAGAGNSEYGGRQSLGFSENWRRRAGASQVQDARFQQRNGLRTCFVYEEFEARLAQGFDLIAPARQQRQRQILRMSSDNKHHQ